MLQTRTHKECSNLTNKYNPQEPVYLSLSGMLSSNLTNKYNPQEPLACASVNGICSNLTNKYNPQELGLWYLYRALGSNLTNKYNPQEHMFSLPKCSTVQILPINTILKNGHSLNT